MIHTEHKKLNWFGGVFTPNVLTILGVIMYLRLGWVVGNAGLVGALFIIMMAKLITIATGLSLSSITTNIRIGAGGAYSIISKSLGLEAGGSIGIPFYVAQTLSAALYIIGFTEGWISFFPSHNYMAVFTITWLSLLVISYVSAHFAIKIQYIIMSIMALSLFSFFVTPAPQIDSVPLIGSFQSADFWTTFAIFFPAVTGIMAGANMSGDLKDPKKAIPLGTMLAILVTMFIYIALAIVLAHIGTPEELVGNQLIMVEKAKWPNLVLAGLLGATFSSALGSMLGAPRILQALAEQKTIPFHHIFARKAANNEPRNAIIFTGILIELSLILGNLNYLASLITMFFLITYGMLNLVVFAQQSMKIISFRPTFKIPRFVSFFGAVSCLFMMFLISPVFSIVAIVTIIGIYLWLGKRQLQSDTGDIRGGLFLTLAEKAARLAIRFPKHQVAWKPDILLPVEDPRVWSGPMLFIRNMIYPIEETENALEELMNPMHEEGILTSSAVIRDDNFVHGAVLLMQATKKMPFRPNILFLTLGDNSEKEHNMNVIIEEAAKNGLGTIILRQHPRVAFGMQKKINLWLRDKSPNWHLALLVALTLQSNWEAQLNIVTVAKSKDEENRLLQFFDHLNDHARLPSQTQFNILIGPFDDIVSEAPHADVNIFGMGPGLPDYQIMRNLPIKTKSSCIFVKSAGGENALA
ncbi:MAG: amino acid permease [Calditrichia bacterium]